MSTISVILIPFANTGKTSINALIVITSLKKGLLLCMEIDPAYYDAFIIRTLLVNKPFLS